MRHPRIALAIAVLVTLHTLFAYGLPPLIPLAATVVLAVVYWWIGAANALLTSGALVVATLVYAGALDVTGLANSIYFRPHEALERYDHDSGRRTYRRSTRMRMLVRQGDLQSMTTQPIAEPREVEFVTDSLGFRNDHDYAGQPYVALGDSFVATLGTTQSETLDHALTRAGVPTYNLGHPGGLDDYAANLAAFTRAHGDGPRVLLFLFEGNDFPRDGHDTVRAPDAPPRSLAWRLLKRYREIFSDTSVYRFTGSLYKRVRARRRIASGEQLIVRTLAGRPFALLGRYVDASRERAYPGDPAFEAQLARLAPRVAATYLIPTKYRVYRGLLEPGAAPLPHARWDYLSRLCTRLAMHCVDLAPPLAAAAARMLGEGRLIWWRDDTHWNGAGAAAAARAVAADLATLAPPLAGKAPSG